MDAPQRSPQRVFITGASSGIGAALARLYAAAGAVVGVAARREEALHLLADANQSCERYALDVREAGALAAAARHFIAKYGVPDVVIANAGVSIGTLTDFAEDTAMFRNVLETNVIGIVNTFQPFLAAMRSRGKGALVGIASVAGYRGLPGAGAYCASKAAVIAYLESLRVELRPSGLKVLTICPGYVATPMTARNPYRMPFLMQPEEAAAGIAEAIARERDYCVIPWQMAIVARVLRAMPNGLYDRIFARAARKPRLQD